MSAVPQLTCVLDTDILSAIMRGTAAATTRAQAYVSMHGRISISIITSYEILRGLRSKNATTQERAFLQFCAASEVIPLSEDVVDIAARIYADLKRSGNLIPDADILIAATALSRGTALATANEKHFRRIEALTVENWLL